MDPKLACIKLKGEYRLAYEKLRHENIMKELELMAKHKIQHPPREHPYIDYTRSARAEMEKWDNSLKDPPGKAKEVKK